MGYFSNGSEGDGYAAKYCDRCIHGHKNNFDCSIWLAHFDLNYEECNKEDSILHRLIPRTEDGWNDQCSLFIPVGDPCDKCGKPTPFERGDMPEGIVWCAKCAANEG